MACGRVGQKHRASSLRGRAPRRALPPRGNGPRRWPSNHATPCVDVTPNDVLRSLRYLLDVGDELQGLA